MTRLLRSALRAEWLRGALIVLLLAAQHGALTHALMHAGKAAQGQTAHLSISHAQTASADHGHEHPVRKLTESCAFDLVYNQVLGAVHAGHDFDLAIAEQALLVVAAPAVRKPGTAVPYDSRGPPVFS